MMTQPRTPERLTSGKVPFAIALGAVVLVYAMWQNLARNIQPALLTGSAEMSTPQTIVVQDTPVVVPENNIASTSGNIGSGTAGLYADGTYTGDIADAYYGTIQVQAIVTNGKLTDVEFLQSPSERSNSQVINNAAMPLLVQEALKVQSAAVDGVSGATFTSDAFKQSLASALALAKN